MVHTRELASITSGVRDARVLRITVGPICSNGIRNSAACEREASVVVELGLRHLSADSRALRQDPSAVDTLRLPMGYITTP